MGLKRIYQLGMEFRLAAHTLMLWEEGEYDCDMRIRRARTKGLVVVELDDIDLANKIAAATRCKVAFKEVKV